MKDVPRIIPRFLPYVHLLAKRPLDRLRLIVIHCTELPTLELSRQFGEQVHYADGTGNSGHYYIDPQGQIQEYVPLDRVAHHVKGFNAASIGIELVNTGRYPHWHHSQHQTMHAPYPRQQIAALCQLLHFLCEQLPGVTHIAGHEVLDTQHVCASDNPKRSVARKCDPGPKFPWDEVMSSLHLARILEKEQAQNMP